MLARQEQRLFAKLLEIDTALRKRPQPTVAAVKRRVGRGLGRYPAADKLFEVTVQQNETGQACGLAIACLLDRSQWARQAQGVYLLRTNGLESDPAKLWHWYLQLEQAEAPFALPRAISGCTPCFTTRPSGWKPISWSAFWRWRYGAHWRCG